MENKRGKILNIASLLFLLAAALLLPFEMSWGSRALAIYVPLGFLSAILMAAFFFRDKLWRQRDIRLLLVMLVLLPVSVILSRGFYPGLIFKTRGYYVWLILFGLYFVMRSADDPERLLRCFAAAMTAALAVGSAIVIVRATADLVGAAASDIYAGCFRRGRLWAYGNPNIFAFFASALLMLSLYGRLSAKTKTGRILYVLSLILGVFALGLTNSRTCIIGCAFSAGLVVYAAVLRRLEEKKRLVRQLAAIAAAAAVCVASCALLCMPLRIYRWTLTAYAQVFNMPELLERLKYFFARKMRLRTISVLSRLDIWQAAIREVFGSAKTALFGFSFAWLEPIRVVGKNYSMAAWHAHNSYIELLRQHGLLGCGVMMSLTVWWGAKGAKAVYDKERGLPEICLMGIAAGTLLIGMMEQMPYPSSCICSLGAVFFLICGYCVRRSA